MPHHKKEIVLIVFDIDSDNRYEKLKALEKINLLTQRIHDVCKILKTKNPHATWIIAWREYGVRERDTLSISNKIKRQFKKTMLEISNQYQNLIIIAGTVLTRKKKPVACLNDIKKYYKKLDWIHKIEKKDGGTQVAKHKQEIADVSQKIKNNHSATIRVTSNKARVYFHGKEKRHGKAAPFDENNNIPNAIYQPGKGNNLNPVITIHEHPLDISIGIDICREHADDIHYLKTVVENKKKSQKPLLHFIISATIDLHLKSLCAKLGAIHVDSQQPPRMILSRGYQYQNVDIKLYRSDVMEPIKNLVDVIEPEYPVQYKLLDKIDKMFQARTLPDHILKQLRSYILDNMLGYYNSMEGFKNLLNSHVPYHIKLDFNNIIYSGAKPPIQCYPPSNITFYKRKYYTKKLDEELPNKCSRL